jgi:mercuric ion transport protein
LGIICCFTPVLPAVLTGIGTAGLIDTLYRDAVLLPFNRVV